MKHAHYVVATLLVLFIVPAFRIAHIPLEFPWWEFIYRFYCLLFIESMLVAILLFAIGHPAQLWRIITSERGPNVSPTELFTRIALPGTYLFLVLLLTFSYNNVIATFRFDGVMDGILNRMDGWIMGGWTVADLSRRVSFVMSKKLEAIYYQMFLQIGSCLLIVALSDGRKRAMQYVGAIASAYFMGLAMFYFIPATGPYYLSILQPNGGYTGLGAGVVEKLTKIMMHQRVQVSTDWYVAFPCLHIAQPLIVLWFMRKARTIALILIAFDLVLIPVILILQAHYVVDLVGGACVALLAIVMVDETLLSGEAGRQGFRNISNDQPSPKK